MAGLRGAPEIVLIASERSELEGLARRRKTAQALAMRARIVLACAEGLQSKQVATALGVDQATVGKWRHRFAARRLDGLRDEPRSGAPRTIEDARIEAVIVTTLESLPEDATHWSSRGMAKACGLELAELLDFRTDPVVLTESQQEDGFKATAGKSARRPARRRSITIPRHRCVFTRSRPVTSCLRWTLPD